MYIVFDEVEWNYQIVTISTVFYFVYFLKIYFNHGWATTSSVDNFSILGVYSLVWVVSS